MPNPPLKIPIAYDPTGAVVFAHAAPRGAGYRCPGCSGPLLLKAGPIRVAHFAHPPPTTCTAKTVLHQAAKQLILATVAAWCAGQAPAPVIKRACVSCPVSHDQPLPTRVTQAVLEYRLPTGHIVDVALLAEDQCVAAVEILVTHAVDIPKATALPVPWVEVAAEAILAIPTYWQPLQERLRPYTCPACREQGKRFATYLAYVAARRCFARPTAYYRTTVTRCWQCKRVIPVFTWPGQALHAEVLPRHMPRPRTLRRIQSRAVDAPYWANTCAYCGQLQGDFPLYMDPDGAFFSFQCGEDTSAAWAHDQLVLAQLYAERERPAGTR